jgi:hypothetical protein
MQNENNEIVLESAINGNSKVFFQRRSQGADQVDFLEILRNSPDRPPDPGGRIGIDVIPVLWPV